MRCPNVETVERVLGNWGHVQRSPRVLELMEAAVQRWGRDNLFDWPTKIGIITSIQNNHKEQETARKGEEVCIKIEPIPGNVKHSSPLFT